MLGSTQGGSRTSELRSSRGAGTPSSHDGRDQTPSVDATLQSPLADLQHRLKALMFRDARLSDGRQSTARLSDLARRLETCQTPEDLANLETALGLSEGEVAVREVVADGLLQAEARSKAAAKAVRQAFDDFMDLCKVQLRQLLQALDSQSRDQSVHLQQVVVRGTSEVLKAQVRTGLTRDFDVSPPSAPGPSLG